MMRLYPSFKCPANSTTTLDVNSNNRLSSMVVILKKRRQGDCYLGKSNQRASIAVFALISNFCSGSTEKPSPCSNN